MHAKLIYSAQGNTSIVQKLSNKQSAKVICGLRTAHSKRQKAKEH